MADESAAPARRELRVALVGCGGIAQAHWRGIRYVARRVGVTAVVDPDADARIAMARLTGAPAFATLDDALASGGFEAVDIMTPHDTHEANAAACLAAGKHVLLEKPIAHTLGSAERVLATARAHADRVFMVAEQAQYWHDVRRARELIDEGAIGHVLHARACYFDRLRFDPSAPKPWRHVRGRAGGGLTIDGGAHWIRPLRMLLGEVEQAMAVVGHHVPGMEGESWSRSLLRFASGVVATLECTYVLVAHAPYEMFRVTGTDGELVIGAGRGAQLVLYDAQSPRGRVIMDANAAKANSYGEEIADFAAAVLDGTAPAATAEYALGELRTALAIYRSAESGWWEPVW